MITVFYLFIFFTWHPNFLSSVCNLFSVRLHKVGPVGRFDLASQMFLVKKIKLTHIYNKLLFILFCFFVILAQNAGVSQ